jgi:hypothetical protein
MLSRQAFVEIVVWEVPKPLSGCRSTRIEACDRAPFTAGNAHTVVLGAQGMITRTAAEPPKLRAHARWFSNQT